MAKTKDKLMLTKQEIVQAIEESQDVKKGYPAFWKFYEMLLAMHEGFTQLEDLGGKDGQHK